MHETCQAGFSVPRAVLHAGVMDTLDSSAPVADATAPMPNGGLEVISIAKSYDKRSVLSDISLTVAKGEVLGLLGESGSGKSVRARPPASIRSWASSDPIRAAS